MKKLVSLLLAVCMCLSVGVILTACGHEHTWNEGEITTPATATADGVKTFTCTECGETKTESVALKTTVTEAEWNAAFALTNATASGFLTENGEQDSVLFKIADTVYYSEINDYIAWAVEKDGEYYMYSVNNSEGQLLNGFSIAVSTMLMSFHLPEYASFTYDETTKSYTCINTDYPEAYYKFNVYFENNFVVKFESRNNTNVVQYSFDFTNYGTTTIELPEIPEHTHTYKTEWSKDTTHHWHDCESEDCTEVSDKAEHTWNDGEITTPATAQTDGVKTFTCTVCTQTKTESVEYVVDYTVTEAEWKINLNLTKGQAQAQPLSCAAVSQTQAQPLSSNSSQALTGITSYTVYAVGENAGTTGTSLLKVSPDAMFIEFYVEGTLEDESGTYGSNETLYQTLIRNITVYFPFADNYNDFTFDQTKNAYVAQDLTSIMVDDYDPTETSLVYTKSAEVTFVNGYLNTITVELCDKTFEDVYASFVFTFSDINNTTVEV
ncbi:MAG: hypothetical protein IJX38_06085 [Clostridia bacterium]|nr:hypothetical protein [Clostridia bacterium]